MPFIRVPYREDFDARGRSCGAARTVDDAYKKTKQKKTGASFATAKKSLRFLWQFAAATANCYSKVPFFGRYRNSLLRAAHFDNVKF